MSSAEARAEESKARRRAEAKEREKRLWPARLARFRKIQTYQRSNHLLLPRLHVELNCRVAALRAADQVNIGRAAGDQEEDRRIQMSGDAITLFHMALEKMLDERLFKSFIVALHCKRQAVGKSDLRLVEELEGLQYGPARARLPAKYDVF